VSLQNAQWNKQHATRVEQFAKNDIWLLTGKGALLIPSTSNGSQNVTSPILDASFSVVMLNCTAMRGHTISDFRMIGNPAMDRAEKSIALRGLATITMNDGPHTKVPISITIIDKSVMMIAIDEAKTAGHFGYTQSSKRC